MANKKRRTSERKRGSSSTQNPWFKRSEEDIQTTWLGEALAFVALAVSFLIASSILSFELYSTGYDTLPSAQPETSWNFIGPLGHVFATLATGALGWASLFGSLWCLWLACRLWFWEEGTPLLHNNRGWLSVMIGFLVSTLTLSACMSLLMTPSSGGSIGELLSQPVIKLFGQGGAGVLFALLLISSLTFALNQTALSLFQFSITGTYRLIRYIPRTLGKMLASAWDISVWFIAHAVTSQPFQFLLFLPQKIRSHFSSDDEYYDEYDYDEQDDDEEEDQVVPSPRRHKNRVQEEEIEEYEWEEDEESQVVVERRAATKRASLQDIRLARKKIVASRVDQQNAQKYAQYEPPTLELLKPGETSLDAEDDDSLKKKSRLIEEKLRDFNIAGKVTHVHPGPVITLFEFEPAPGVKVGKIAALQDDLSMSLKASSLRIIAPIPRRGTVGIEVPNKHHDIVRLRDVLESEEFISADSPLTIPLGKDTYGNPVIGDIADMPHLLMAGATGTGKSVCINAFLLSLLYRANPAELGLILIDPKILELSVYEGIPHLRVPVVTDPKKAKAVLQWAVNEMESRYKMMQRYGVRSIDGYNRKVAGNEFLQPEDESTPSPDTGIIKLTDEHVVAEGVVESEATAENEPTQQPLVTEELMPLPKIVIVIDELADLMLSSGREVEELITRLAQKARAAGIHIILATQRPSVDVITGLIKANFPARLSFRVSSRIDSRTILDSMGAEKLLGRGDMLFMKPGGMHLQRIHGSFVSDSEVQRVVTYIKERCGPCYDQKIIDMCEKALEDEGSSGGMLSEDEEYDPVYDKAVALVVEKGQASTSMVQRAFRIGYNRAARIIDVMEREGIVGPMDGAKPRQILIDPLDDALDEEGSSAA